MIKKTIWVTGSGGRLGPAIIKELGKNIENKVFGTDTDVDITDMKAVDQIMKLYRPNVIINCAAMSNAAYCEENRVEAYKINALGARNLAIAANNANCKLIHISTDDVFDGKKSGNWNEFDNPEPKSVYGKSKLAGEQYVSSLCPKHLIVRSSWVYGGSTGNDYFNYVVAKGKAGEAFDSPVDKVSTPTSRDELCKFICKMVDIAEYGVYHVACEGMCTRNEFAKFVLKEMGYETSLARGVFSDGDQSSTLLDNLMMKMTQVHEMPSWQDALKAYIEKVKA